MQVCPVSHIHIQSIPISLHPILEIRLPPLLCTFGKYPSILSVLPLYPLMVDLECGRENIGTNVLFRADARSQVKVGRR